MGTEFAAAKVNLTLHVTGQRDDGYHLLDSLVVFVGIGDVLHAKRAPETGLTIEGPFAASLPAGADNLVLRAAALFSPDKGVAFMLQKHLPPASGIGGGSADAAAAIRLIMKLQTAETLAALAGDDDGAAAKATFPTLNHAAVQSLGADVLACLSSRPARMRGIGNDLTFIKSPECWITLVNPGVEVPTPQVFAALAAKNNPKMPDDLPDWRDAADLAQWLHTQRNDLEPPAQMIAPVIGDVLTALRALPATLIARMSGSGATCFALSASQAGAEAIAAALRATHPGWWVESGVVYPGLGK